MEVCKGSACGWERERSSAASLSPLKSSAQSRPLVTLRCSPETRNTRPNTDKPMKTRQPCLLPNGRFSVCRNVWGMLSRVHTVWFSKSSDHRCFHSARLSGVAFSCCCVHIARWIGDRRLHTAAPPCPVSCSLIGCRSSPMYFSVRTHSHSMILNRRQLQISRRIGDSLRSRLW